MRPAGLEILPSIYESFYFESVVMHHLFDQKIHKYLENFPNSLLQVPVMLVAEAQFHRMTSAVVKYDGTIQLDCEDRLCPGPPRERKKKVIMRRCWKSGLFSNRVLCVST